MACLKCGEPCYGYVPICNGCAGTPSHLETLKKRLVKAKEMTTQTEKTDLEKALEVVIKADEFEGFAYRKEVAGLLAPYLGTIRQALSTALTRKGELPFVLKEAHKLLKWAAEEFDKHKISNDAWRGEFQNWEHYDYAAQTQDSGNEGGDTPPEFEEAFQKHKWDLLADDSPAQPAGNTGVELSKAELGKMLDDVVHYGSGMTLTHIAPREYTASVPDGVVEALETYEKVCREEKFYDFGMAAREALQALTRGG